jgi:hypothetical protein
MEVNNQENFVIKLNLLNYKKKIVLHLKFIRIRIFFKDSIEIFDFRFCNFRK